MKLDLEELEKIEKISNPYIYSENRYCYTDRVYESIIYNNLRKFPTNMKKCALENVVEFIKHSHIVATTDSNEAIYFNKNGIPFTRKIDEDFINNFETIYNEVENIYLKITKYPIDNDCTFINKSSIFKININNYLKKYSNVDKNTLYIMALFYSNINILNKNLALLNSLSKEEQNIILEYIKPLSYDLTKKYANQQSVYEELYCYFNEHFIKSFKLITDLIIKKEKIKLNILLNYKKYLESDYPEYNPGRQSEYIQYGEWVEVPDKGADTEAAWYPTHQVYVPRTKVIDHPASLPTYRLEILEKTLTNLEKKDFEKIDLNLLAPSYNYLKENFINMSKALVLNGDEDKKMELIKYIQNFNYQISDIFNKNFNLNVNLEELNVDNIEINLENAYLNLLSSLDVFSKEILAISYKYIEKNIQVSDILFVDYKNFLKEKLETKINYLITELKNNLLDLIKEEKNNILQLTI